tara:strand:- start:23 stop:193 length:171 start_codon:yes stop_codon:yes gene_type:complete
MKEVTVQIQSDFDTLVQSGMDYMQEPIKATYNTPVGDVIVFLVSKEIADKYWTSVI